MANVILLKDYQNNDKVWRLPLLDHPQIEISSSFESMLDGIPFIDGIISLFQTMSKLDSLDSTVSGGNVEFNNTMDLPRWKKTEPVIFSTKLLFYTKTDPKADVWDAMFKLIEYTIITKQDDGTYLVPGISLKAAKDLADASEGQDVLTSNSKLLSIEIPGVIYLSPVMVEKATPTYSKEVTESGYPLWGQLDISFKGLYPASDLVFKQVSTSPRITV